MQPELSLLMEQREDFRAGGQLVFGTVNPQNPSRSLAISQGGMVLKVKPQGRWSGP